ncbi:MAG: hypothetical protein QOE99_2211 [Actinomycetota bacterium]|nr:hypothetical protein [Actinomycetota bacterium]
MKADAQTEAVMVGMLESFCSAFQARDAEAVMRLFAPDPDLVVVTSEESLLRGPHELQTFLRAYEQGPATYSWIWDRLEVSTADAVAWLLAEGTETAATQDGEQEHPYRMTIVCERRDEQWLLVQMHGSSPQHG